MSRGKNVLRKPVLSGQLESDMGKVQNISDTPPRIRSISACMSEYLCTSIHDSA